MTNLAAAEIGTDVSEWQTYLTDDYGHRFIILRSSLSTYKIDNKIGTNSARAKAMLDAGQLDFVLIYHVWYPGDPGRQLANMTAAIGGWHPRFAAMIDYETWGGDISGDHSDELNDFAGTIARELGDPRRVVGYGNRGDLASGWPGRPEWLRVIVAAYGSRIPSDVPGFIGHQYSNGQVGNAVPVGSWPRASAPFGPCDHDAFPGMTSSDVMAALGLDGTAGAGLSGAALTPTVPEDDMSNYIKPYIVGLAGHGQPNDVGAAYYLINDNESTYTYLPPARFSKLKDGDGIEVLDNQGIDIVLGLKYIGPGGYELVKAV